MCKDCVYYKNPDYCDDCLPFDPVCSLFRAKNAPGSDPDSDTAPQSEVFSGIYEKIMSETQSSHIWHLKNQ